MNLVNLPVDCLLTFKGVNWYHEFNRDSKILFVSAGDSWTWGDSLGNSIASHYDNFEYRTKHIYGELVSSKINADFINIGLPGYSNLVILDKLELILDNLVKSYNTIYVVVTLTESGRDLLEPFLSRELQYNNAKQDNWPTFQQLSSRQLTVDYLPKIYSDSNRYEPGQTTHMKDSYELHNALCNSKNLCSIFVEYENHILEKFNQLSRISNLKLKLGRNFTSWATSIDTTMLPKTWVDIISEEGELNSYPSNVHVMSQIGMAPLLEWINLMNLDLKSELDPMMTDSLDAIAWLSKSPYNSQRATKHPMEAAHQWWADYILKNL